MATVMDGIQTQNSSFATILGNGDFTSKKLDGAGRNVVKRVREAMETMSAEYDNQYKKMKRSLATKSESAPEEARASRFPKFDPITTTRSAQGVSIVKAKLVRYRNTLREAKWIVPPHSLVFAKRDKAMDVISAWSDVSNIKYTTDFSATHTLLGVTLEDGLDAEKFHREHVSRRYFSVAVEGVVSVQCPPDILTRCSFGDPIYVREDMIGHLNFYNVLSLMPTNDVKEAKPFARLGYFVEPVDKHRGGMRVKLAIAQIPDLDSYKKNDVADSYDKDVKKFFAQSNAKLRELFGTLDATKQTGELDLTEIENFKASVTDTVNKFLEAADEQESMTSNRLFEIAKKNASSFLENFNEHADKLIELHNTRADRIAKRGEAEELGEEERESSAEAGDEESRPGNENWELLRGRLADLLRLINKNAQNAIDFKKKHFDNLLESLGDSANEDLKKEVESNLETWNQIMTQNTKKVENYVNDYFSREISNAQDGKWNWEFHDELSNKLNAPQDLEEVANLEMQTYAADKQYLGPIDEKIQKLIEAKLAAENPNPSSDSDAPTEDERAELEEIVEQEILKTVQMLELMDLKEPEGNETTTTTRLTSVGSHFKEMDTQYADQLKEFLELVETIYFFEKDIANKKQQSKTVNSLKLALHSQYERAQSQFKAILLNSNMKNARLYENGKTKVGKPKIGNWQSNIFLLGDGTYPDMKKNGEFKQNYVGAPEITFMMGKLLYEKLAALPKFSSE